ncbi:MAG TPA: cyclopropane-fatty-acyl-phospholipid synthase family protein [Vicinamibacterales bacterium]|nr:cyclopropane-fatty-acyl-phospholipid synthase family protein [Vicinamibacterales bacterium]
MARLRELQGGTLVVVNARGQYCAGISTRGGEAPSQPPLEATIVIHNDRFYSRALLGGDIGVGESYVDGEWTSPDLVSLIRLMIRNQALVEEHGGALRRLVRLAGGLARRCRDNSPAGSRRHIHEHYDLGNDFFRLFLDDSLVYSSAYYESGRETLEQAQQKKLEAICTKLAIGPGDHVLEIGTGWGAFAVWAASRRGCRVTTATISEEQYRYACDWVSRLGEAGSRITVLLADYRTLQGRFDKVVSIEMFEAVGLNHYDEYFRAVDRLLRPNGSMLLQTITVDEQHFPQYHGEADWIEKYIFPGGELASIGEILGSLQRVSTLSLYHAENFGSHYARTLHEWRARYRRQLDRVRAQGFSERFIRMWDFYLALCEAAFLERHTGVFQLVLNKNYSSATHFNEPWREAGAAAAVA